MVRKILALAFLVIILLSTFLGCQTASNKETVKTALDNFSQAKSYQYSGLTHIKLELPKDNNLPPEEKLYVQMFNDLKLKFNGNFRKEKDIVNASFEISIPLNNMELKLTGYQKGDDIWFRYPILPTYIHMNLKEVNQQRKIESQKNKELNKLILELVSKITSSIDEKKFTAEKVDSNEGKETKITVKLDKDDLSRIFQMLYDFSQNQEVKNTLLGTLQEQQDKDQVKATEEAGNFKKFLDDFKKNVQVNQFTLSFNIINKLLREQKINLDVKSRDEKLNEEAYIKLDSELRYSNVNGNFKIKYPDFEKVGVTELKDLQDQGSLFGGPDGIPNGSPSGL